MSKNITNPSGYSFNTNTNYNQNHEDFKESVNRSLDETKHNINRSLDESKNQIPHFNTIVNRYQEQSLQTAKEISENYIESQKSIINSLQSAWRPYNESFAGLVNNFSSPNSIVKAYSRCVSNFANNAISAMRIANNIIFSNLDSWKSGLQQARDNSRHVFNQNVNAAKTFEQNTRDITDTAKDANSKYNSYSVSSSSSTSIPSVDKNQSSNSKKI